MAVENRVLVCYGHVQYMSGLQVSKENFRMKNARGKEKSQYLKFVTADRSVQAGLLGKLWLVAIEKVNSLGHKAKEKNNFLVIPSRYCGTMINILNKNINLLSTKQDPWVQYCLLQKCAQLASELIALLVLIPSAWNFSCPSRHHPDTDHTHRHLPRNDLKFHSILYFLCTYKLLIDS